MHAEVVKQFPELKLWWVGAEPDLTFYSCQNRLLTVEEYVRFALDSLEGIQRAVRAENPQIQIGFHFLGMAEDPIHLFEEGQTVIVQPVELVNALQKEAASRGYDLFERIDSFSADLDPSLLDLREEPVSEPVPFGQVSSSSSSGWNAKFLEEFNTDTTDLVATYGHWQDVRTDTSVVLVTEVEVNSGKSLLRLEDQPQFQISLAGAVTVNEEEDSQNGVDVVPNQEFQSSPAGSEKDKWTAVSDFFAIPPGTDPAGAHSAAFLRVNNRTYTESYNNANELTCSGTCPDQTRFGTFVRGGAAPGAVCSGSSDGDYGGALQFSGDDKDDPDVGLQWLCEFGMDENPFDSANQNEEYRVQVIEKKVFNTALLRYQLRWRGEVWRSSPGQLSAELIGWTAWKTESTVKGHGIAIAELASSGQGESKLMFALGPGDDGGVDVERTGTAYWVYD